MSAARSLYAAGYSELVSVIPPSGQLSERSSVPADQRGKAPGRLYSRGWGGYNWRAEDVDPAELERTGANVGLRGERFPGLDIDVDDEALARFVEEMAVRVLGEAPVRLSRGSRRLMVYRLDGAPFGRLALKVEWAGEWHTLEWLPAGRQYLVSGVHPSGAEYRWKAAPLWDVPAEDLAPITREGVVAFFDELQAKLASKGIPTERVGDGVQAEDKAPPQEDLKAPSLEALRALPLPPNPAEYGWDEFIAHGYAYKAAGQDDEALAFELWSAWAEQHDAFDAEVCEHEWRKLRPPYRVGWTWLRDRAGWQDAGHVFDAVPDADDGQELPERVRDQGPLRAAFADDGGLSDEAVVALILPQLRDRLRFLASSGAGAGAWKLWRGHVWSDDTGMDHELVIRGQLARVATVLRQMAEAAPSAKEGGPYLNAARRFQSDTGIRAVVRLVRAHLACSPADFDTDHFALNTPAGVVDLRTGRLRPGTPADMMARTTGVAPAAAGTPLGPRFRAFLEFATGGDADLELYLQKQMGYALTGDVSEKGLWFVWGMADTGKSVWVNTISQIFGDYHDSVDAEAFISSKMGRTPDDIARLPGVRLVTATEPSAGQAWNEKTIKSITGGDEISARKLYGSWFTFKPQFKIVIVGNHEPELRQVDDAMLRRIHIVPFDKKVPKDKQIANLSQMMVAEEGDRILRWMLDGAQLWQAEGLQAPAVVHAKTSEYAGEEDTLAQWIEECCEIGDSLEATRQELYESWAHWCRARGEDSGGFKSFRRRMLPVITDYGLRDISVGERRQKGFSRIRLAPFIRSGFGEVA